MNFFNSQQICVFGVVLFKHRESNTVRAVGTHFSSLQDSGAERGSVYTSAQLTFENDSQIRLMKHKETLITSQLKLSLLLPHHTRPLFPPSTPWETQNSEEREAELQKGEVTKIKGLGV